MTVPSQIMQAVRRICIDEKLRDEDWSEAIRWAEIAHLKHLLGSFQSPPDHP